VATSDSLITIYGSVLDLRVTDLTTSLQTTYIGLVIYMLFSEMNYLKVWPSTDF
jgi:hypothetical protein